MCFNESNEILAKQHYNLFKKIFDNENINIGFLSGKTDYKKRKDIVKSLSNGYLLIGTHALFQKKLILKKLVLL